MDVRLLTWLATGDVGMSSCAIATKLSGEDVLRLRFGRSPGALGMAGTHPRDPDDLLRCLRLLEAVPEWQPRIGEMAEVSPIWARLAVAWEELVDLLLEECAAASPHCPRTYARMRDLIDGRRAA